MSRSFGICPKCGTDTFDDIPCSNGCAERKSKMRRFMRRHIPHKTRSGNQWCLPMFWAKIFGGTWDTGNGYAWSPKIWRRESFRFGNVVVSRMKPLFGERHGYDKAVRILGWRFYSLKSNTEPSRSRGETGDQL